MHKHARMSECVWVHQTFVGKQRINVAENTLSLFDFQLIYKYLCNERIPNAECADADQFTVKLFFAVTELSRCLFLSPTLSSILFLPPRVNLISFCQLRRILPLAW